MNMHSAFPRRTRAGRTAATPRDLTELREALARLDLIAHWMDTAFLIPGTTVRFGADALIGLVPGIGDAITTAISSWIVYEAHRIGAPRHLIARMIGHVAIDGLVGAVPLVGDLFDVAYRANRRNLELLRKHLERNTY